MYKRNQWKLGPSSLALPPIPDHWRGISGCQLETTVFDKEVGEEVFLVILDTSEFASDLSNIRPFQVFCKSGMARTNHGTVVFLIVTVRDGQKDITDYEVLLNPHHKGTIQLLSSCAQQSHVKVIVLDSEQNEVRDWFEFENNFDISTLVETIASSISHEKQGDYRLAKEEFTRDYSLEDLKNL